MTEAVLKLDPEAGYVLSDAMPLDLPVPCQPLIKGDNRSISIAAASIIAKVYRDALLNEWDKEFPEYGLAQHKGYATKLHLERLERHGATPLHRRSFRPVREQIALAHIGEQEPLPFHPGTS
jgi:ribonuclease HII